MREMFNLSEELKKLPGKPGVYLMHDDAGRIIYVGKAVNLKNRVRQYFQEGYRKSPKIEQMVKKIAWFEYMVTDSETEALVLECNLIKEHRPRYNTMLTDDKGYPFIRVSVEEDYPRVFLARNMKRDGSRYFGPYTDIGAVRDIIRLVQKLYQIRGCQKRLPQDQRKERPCLNYHMGQCQAPCQGEVPVEDYRTRVENMLDFLSGNITPIEKLLEEEMLLAAEKLEFEEAAAKRELLYGVRRMKERQKVTNRGGENRDILAAAFQGREAVVQVFFVRDGKMIGREHFRLRVGEGDSTARVYTEFVKQFYGGTPFFPQEILLPEQVEEKELIQQWLETRAGHRVLLQVPQRGEKHKLMELAKTNAALILSQNQEKRNREEARTVGALHELEEILGLTDLHRLEAYDISNISGFESVGSMVVYEDGKPKRNDYRKFRIRGVKGPDDYASMEEVLTRRLTHGRRDMEWMREKEEKIGGFSVLPDLILMDGGKGQVGVAIKVLKKLGLTIPVCGMVKDEHHRTRGIYFNGKEREISLSGEAFLLITRIQDEAHRFAIEYHRSRRGKAQVHSVLDEIQGIGPTRRKALMKAFGTREAMEEATVEELAAIPSMNRSVAKQVYAFFHEGEIPSEEEK